MIAQDRRMAAAYLTSWLVAIKDRDWTAAQVIDKVYQLAEDIRKGVHATDLIARQRSGT